MNENENENENENQKMEKKLYIKGGENSFNVDYGFGRFNYGTKFDVDEIIEKIVSFSDRFRLEEHLSIKKEDICNFLYKLKDKNTTWWIVHDGLKLTCKGIRYSFKDKQINHDGILCLHLSFMGEDFIQTMTLHFFSEKIKIQFFYIYYLLGKYYSIK